jgi:hypothetical protein
VASPTCGSARPPSQRSIPVVRSVVNSSRSASTSSPFVNSSRSASTSHPKPSRPLDLRTTRLATTAPRDAASASASASASLGSCHLRSYPPSVPYAREATSISSGGCPRIGHLHRLLQSPTASAGTSAVVPRSKCRYVFYPSCLHNLQPLVQSRSMVASNPLEIRGSTVEVSNTRVSIPNLRCSC